MKKYIYTISILVSFLASCEAPLEDTYRELDALKEGQERFPDVLIENVQDVTFTLEESDYDEFDDSQIGQRKNFETVTQAESLLASFLKKNARTAILTNGSNARVIYAIDATINNPANETIDTEGVDEQYEVTEADYDSQGGNVARFGNFSSLENIIDFLNDKYDAATVDFKVELTYIFFDRNADPRTQTLTTVFTFDGTTWVTTETYTVTEADYDSQGGNVARFDNFSSDRGIDDIINFLNDRYPTATADLKVELTYEYFLRNPNRTETTTNTFVFTGTTWEIFIGTITATNEIYEVTEDDYDSQGGNIERFNNFEEISAVTKFLKDRYELTLENATVKLTYIFRENSENNEVTKLYQSDSNSNWNLIEGRLLTSEDYQNLQENDSFAEDAKVFEAKLPIFLKNTLLPFAVEGDIENIIYETENLSSKGSNKTNYNFISLLFEKGQWISFPNSTSAVSNFAFDGIEWKAGKIFKYRFVEDDYNAIVTEFETKEGFSDAANNLERFGNFNTRNWTDDLLIPAISFILKREYPEVEIGQQFSVTIDIFDGSVTTQDISLTFDENGNFIKI